MKILLTGSDGFIGKNLKTYLEVKKHTIIEIDRNSGNNLLTCDLKYDVDWVIHLAGIAGVRDSLENPPSIGHKTLSQVKEYLTISKTQKFYTQVQVQHMNPGEIHMQ